MISPILWIFGILLLFFGLFCLIMAWLKRKKKDPPNSFWREHDLSPKSRWLILGCLFTWFGSFLSAFGEEPPGTAAWPYLLGSLVKYAGLYLLLLIEIQGDIRKVKREREQEKQEEVDKLTSI